jgi:hypothetical protein
LASSPPPNFFIIYPNLFNMRFFLAIPLLLSALVSAAPKATSEKKEVEWSDEDQPVTEFNHQEVPPIVQLTGDDFDETAAKGIWYARKPMDWPEDHRANMQ